MRWMHCALLVGWLSGCHAYYVDVDGRLSERAGRPIDEPKGSAGMIAPRHLPRLLPPSGALTHAEHLQRPRNDAPVLVTFAQKDPLPGKDKNAYDLIMKRLEFPESALGFRVKDIELWKPGATEKEKDEKLKLQFPDLEEVKPLPAAQVGPAGRPLSVADLQQIALRTNPVIRQAHLDIESARGLALQAKLYPNPSIGYEGSTVGQRNSDGNRSPGQQGGFVEQQIVTMGKLKLAHEAALRDVDIAEQKLRQVEADVQAQVRAGYFAVLSARKNYETTRALTALTDSLYKVLLQQMRAGEAAAYEPMQIRVLALQARAALIQAQNRYTTAWKTLAASLGNPNMPLTALTGQIDMPVPVLEQERVLAYVLEHHSEVRSAQFNVERNRFLVRLAEVQPYPDITVHTAFQKDYTTPPFGSVANVSVSVPFPLMNRNQGNIQSARAQLRRSLDDNARVRNELTARVAEAFERYQNNRVLLKMYKEQILPNQVQAFRASVARYAALGPDLGKVSYNDLVTSQQTLAGLIHTYLGALNEQWSSVVEITHLLQSRDLFQTQALEEVAPVPEVHEILRRGLFHRR